MAAAEKSDTDYFNFSQIDKVKKANSEPVVLTERVELEESPLSDSEEITKTYNVHDWHNLTGTQFDVRQKNYFQLKADGGTGKAPSGPGMYRVLKSCMYYGESANIDPRENLDLPFNPDFPEKCQLPEYLVVNVCVPHYEPGLLQNATEGPSTMLMAVCKITDECVKRWVDDEPNEADKLLVRFLYKPTPPEGNYNVRRRLKCIVRMVNFGAEVVNFGWALKQVVSQYNGTPFLLRDSTRFFEGKNFMVVTADANHFGRLAKNSLWSCRPYTLHAVNDVCMIIEGTGDDNEELNENVVFAMRLAKLPFFPDLVKEKSTAPKS